MADRTKPSGYSRLQVALHWLTVTLLVVQYLIHPFMESAFEARQDGEPVPGGDFVGAWFHAGIGATIAIIMITRLVLRFSRGTPPSPEGQPKWAAVLATVTHYALYAILLVLAASGAAAWFGGLEPPARVHETLIPVLFVVAGLHIAGALVEHFIMHTTALVRMLRPQRD